MIDDDQSWGRDKEVLGGWWMARRVGLNGHSFVRLTIHPNKLSTFFPRPGSFRYTDWQKWPDHRAIFVESPAPPIWTPACRRPGPSVRASGSAAPELIDSCRQGLDFFCLLAQAEASEGASKSTTPASIHFASFLSFADLARQPALIQPPGFRPFSIAHPAGPV